MPQYDRCTAEVPLFKDRCSSCFAPDATVFYFETGAATHLCRKCAHQNALWESGYQQLKAQVRAAARAWLPIWGNVPGISYLHEALTAIAYELEEEFPGSGK